MAAGWHMPMGDITRLPNAKAEAREAMVMGLRTMADAIEQGIDDFDGIIVAGYYRETEEIEPYTYNLYNSETAWVGLQLQNWALVDHAGDDD